MVNLVRQGYSQRAVARRFGVSVSVVQRWVGRAHRQRLDRVDWSDRPVGPKTAPNRCTAAQEARVVRLRRELAGSPLGECGALAIAAAWGGGGMPPPSVRTMGRILERRGLLDGRPRQRHPAPPRGWYLPAVAARRKELDSFDCVEGLLIAGYGEIEVFNGISLHGGVVDSWPADAVTTDTVLAALAQRWRQQGLPAFAQFDNDTRFQGAHQWADSLGRVIRFCLQLGVVPVFAPPRETGFQAAIENYNGRWQAKVWSRWRHPDLAGLATRSAAYVAAYRQRAGVRAEQAPPRRPWPRDWQFDPRARPQGLLIYLRRSDAAGRVQVLGHRLEIGPRWAHRLVRAEVDLTAEQIRCYALRRRAPDQQPLLKKTHYAFPHPKPTR